jgi:hypothetical protein
MVVIPVPPPSAISVGSEGKGARLPISSSASSRAGRGGRRDRGGEAAGGFDEVFHERRDQRGGVVRPGTGREQVEGAALGGSFGVEVLVRAGLTASSTRGSARAARDRETPCQMESRVLGSESIIACNESAHPVAAFGFAVRIATASAAAEGRVSTGTTRLVAVIEGGGVQECLECGAGLAFPEAAASTPPADSRCRRRGRWRGSSPSAGPHTADGRPAQPGGHAFGEVLRVEHRDRPTFREHGGSR